MLGHNFLHMVQQKFLLMHHFQIFFSLQQTTDSVSITCCTLKCQWSFRHRCAITVTHCNSASWLGYLSMLYQEKYKNNLLLWFSFTAVTEDPYLQAIPYFTDTGCMHALPWQRIRGTFVCLISTYGPCLQNSLPQLRQRDNTIAKGAAASHAVLCKHKGAGLHLKCQKRASEWCRLWKESFCWY